MAIAYLELVELAQPDVRHEYLPHAGAAQRTHRIHTPVPAVEIAHHADAFGIRRPHRKAHTPHALHLHVVRAEHAVSLLQAAFREQVEIVFADAAAEGIGIMHFDDMVEEIQPAGGMAWAAPACPASDKKPLDVFALQRLPAIAVMDGDLGRMRLKDPQNPTGLVLMQPQI